MFHSDAAEQARLEAQQRLDTAKSHAERNRLGQFATPTALALDVLQCARELLPANVPVRFLDPAIGTGSFYSALTRVWPASQIAAAQGFEIDPDVARTAAGLWQNTNLRVELGDFTAVMPPARDDDRANLLICNPPYVRHHHLREGDKSRLQQAAERATGIRLNGLTGLYCYFLLIADAWLARDGLAGWLIPSEFMDVNYGREIKRYLLKNVTLLRVHRFDPDDVQFGDALVSSAVVWYRKAHPPVDHVVEFSYGGSLAEPRVARRVPLATLEEKAKWTAIPLNAPRDGDEPTFARLSDLFEIRRGIATGSNEFFILKTQEAAECSLPREFLMPILPSPRYLTVDEIEADAQGNPLLREPLVLLSCDLPEYQVQEKYPSLWRYLQHGVERGIHARYLSQHRSPWYAQESRAAAPLLCTYMGRLDGKDGRPFRFILNHSRATAPNVYLMLYPKPPLASILAAQPGLLRDVWHALQSIPLAALVGEGRVYGGGLYKLEPRELANASAEMTLAAIPQLAHQQPRQMSLFGQ